MNYSIGFNPNPEDLRQSISSIDYNSVQLQEIWLYIWFLN